jgi:hypothetical protein
MNKYLSKFTTKVSDYNENDKRVRKLLLPIAKKNINAFKPTMKPNKTDYFKSQIIKPRRKQ